MATYDLGKVVGDKGDKGDKGDTGANGNGIQSIVLRSTVGKVKTYRITFTNGDTFDFQVTDGEDGSSSEVEIVTSWNNTLSDEKVPSEKLSKNSLDGKAPTSHASSSNTYGLGSTSNYGHVKTINGLTQSSHSDGTALSAYQGKVLKDAIDAKPNASDIPTKTSDLTNDGDGTNVFVKNNDSRLTDARTPTSHTHGNLTNDGKVGSSSNYFVYTTTSGAITSKQKIGNITTSGAIGSTSGKPIITTTNGVLTTGSFGTSSGTFAEGNHTHSGYQATLVSGTNIKTINNESLLGSGNITIQGGGSVDIVTSWESTPSDSKVASEKLVKDTLDTKLGTTLTPSTMSFNNGNKPLVVEYNTNVIKTSIFADTYVAHTGSLANITSTSNPTQAEINSGVNTKIGDLEDLIGDAITYINQ